MVERAEEKGQHDQVTFTDRLRISFKWFLDPIANGLNRMGVRANMLTLAGLVGITVSAYFLSQGRFTLGGAIFLLMTPLDALDGPLARLRGEPKNFGAFVDSVTDRYSELVIYAGLLWYAQENRDAFFVMTIYFAAFGSVLVSYIRARAQSVGLEAKVGWFSRVERYLILGPALLFNIPFIGVTIVALGSNATALQRILYVRQVSRKQKA
ncbi:MAG: CDP-alcohol phosphatidyltransferase family protein [Anaerolineales bacterium]